ncbi:DUF6300 family protein [Streptomyces sp. NPDC057301]|uniref:DUF6300 family protein n=1 Tax=Streptomyces sp. NPDC057301 TaxID=3346093 RepID=UPI003631FC96
MAGRGVSRERKDAYTVLVKIADTPPCPQCTGSTMLLAQFAHAWENGRGEDVSGRRETVLCPGCHHKEPTAAELIALFAAHAQVRPESMDIFGGLVAAWVESVRQHTVDEEALAAEFELWEQGEL